MGNLLIALQITIVGMGLVFITILLLWAMIALLVKMTEKSSRREVETTASDERSPDVQDLKYRAAAAAVTLALATRREVPAEHSLHEFPLPPTAIVSAWQAVRRADGLNKRGHTR